MLKYKENHAFKRLIMAQLKGEGLKVGFDSSLRLEFHGSKVTSDAGLIPYRDLAAYWDCLIRWLKI